MKDVTNKLAIGLAAFAAGAKAAAPGQASVVQLSSVPTFTPPPSSVGNFNATTDLASQASQGNTFFYPTSGSFNAVPGGGFFDAPHGPSGDQCKWGVQVGGEQYCNGAAEADQVYGSWNFMDVAKDGNGYNISNYGVGGNPPLPADYAAVVRYESKYYHVPKAGAVIDLDGSPAPTQSSASTVAGSSAVSPATSISPPSSVASTPLQTFTQSADATRAAENPIGSAYNGASAVASNVMEAGSSIASVAASKVTEAVSSVASEFYKAALSYGSEMYNYLPAAQTQAPRVLQAGR